MLHTWALGLLPNLRLAMPGGPLWEAPPVVMTALGSRTGALHSIHEKGFSIHISVLTAFC